MRSLYVDGLIQRERYFVADNSAIHCAIKVCDAGLRETRNKFLDVSNPLSGTGRLTRAECVPVFQILGGIVNSITGTSELGNYRNSRTMAYSKPFHSSSVNNSQNLEKPSETIFIHCEFLNLAIANSIDRLTS